MPNTQAHATWLRTLTQNTSHLNKYYVATCVSVRLDRYNNSRDEILTPTGRHLFCCYLTTVPRTGWAGRLLPRFLFVFFFTVPRSLPAANVAYLEHKVRVTLRSSHKTYIEITSKRKRSKGHEACMEELKGAYQIIIKH